MTFTSTAVAAAFLTTAGLGALAPTAGAQETGALASSYCNSTMTSNNNMGAFHTRIPAYVTTTSDGVTHRYSRCIMAKGASGSHVKALQRILNHCYARGLSVDGDFGTNTKNALEYAQRLASPSVTVDGVWGPDTLHGVNLPGFNSNGQHNGHCYSAVY
ncbi:peptidoglycan-binding domain-containing protein [Streptomyces sp. NPDC055099]